MDVPCAAAASRAPRAGAAARPALRVAAALLLAAAAASSGCGSLRRAVVKEISNGLLDGRAVEVFTGEDDPALVWEAMPSAIKSMELLLSSGAENPRLCQALAVCYVVYAQGRLAADARRLEATDFSMARGVWRRAAKLSLRGRDYALRALDARHPGIRDELAAGRAGRLRDAQAEDVPALYWAALGWAGAVGNTPSDMQTMADLPVAAALMGRVLELDEGFDNGGVHEFLCAYEAARAPAAGGSFERAEEHFRKAVSLSGGLKASPYATCAAAVAVPRQDVRLFKELLGKALAVDPESAPDCRLANVLAQEKARWLLSRGPELFIEYE